MRRSTPTTSSPPRTSSSRTAPPPASERWEEQSGFSPSTIAAEIAGLVAAAGPRAGKRRHDVGALWLGVADDWQRSVKGWTVTTSGQLAAHPYFIRLSKNGDPNAAISYNVGNGGATLDQRDIIDAGFLELVGSARCRRRPDVVPVAAGRRRDDPVDDAERAPAGTATTATGTATVRATDGRGPERQGTGHLWPVALGGAGRAAAGLRATPPKPRRSSQGMSDFASGIGLIPEQDWELPDLDVSPFGTDPTLASIGFENGKAAGAASPLTWSASAPRKTSPAQTGREALDAYHFYDPLPEASQSTLGGPEPVFLATTILGSSQGPTVLTAGSRDIDTGCEARATYEQLAPSSKRAITYFATAPDPGLTKILALGGLKLSASCNPGDLSVYASTDHRNALLHTSVVGPGGALAAADDDFDNPNSHPQFLLDFGGINRVGYMIYVSPSGRVVSLDWVGANSGNDCAFSGIATSGR